MFWYHYLTITYFNLKEAYTKQIENQPDARPDEVWFEVNEGFQKGGVYGVGNASDVLYNNPGRRLSSMVKSSYMPGIVVQLEDRIATQDDRLTAQDEELRKLREEMEMMRTYVQGCNPGFRPFNPDPRDPHGGGGSGASCGFQV